VTAALSLPDIVEVPQSRFPAVCWRVVGGIAAAALALHVALAGRYGLHFDEWYYIVGGRRLQWGYVDHPPVTPLLARLAYDLSGGSQFVFRMVPAMAHVALVLVAALMARRLGGGRWAQGVAALAVVVSGTFLVAGTWFQTVPFDALVWAAGSYLVLCFIQRGGADRGWLALGAVVGVGLLVKHTVLFWVAGTLIGLLVTGQRRLLRSRWLIAAVAIAGLIALPNLIWQIQHGWPTLEFIRHVRGHSGDAGAGPLLIPFQFVLNTPITAVIWLPGLLWLLRSADARDYRSFGWAYLVVIAALLVSGGKAYYSSPMYVVLFAAGGVAVERRLRTHVGWRRTVAALVASGITTVYLTLPVLPASSFQGSITQKVNKEVGWMVGWPEFVDTVADAARELSPAERPTAVIFTSNYGEASALLVLGQDRHLPPVISAHNTYWLWGYGHATTGAAIAVGVPVDQLHTLFSDVRLVATITNRYGVHNIEYGRPVYVCRGQKVSWPQAWPSLKHLE
jgi:4-amino-4-deoxy-L-arabinose transferase-like glycosyltransferase